MKTPKNWSMTSSNPTEKNNKPSKPQTSTNYSATEKAQAVLAVWTERCKAAEVCRQMQVNNMTFQHWQNRAMEGMLQALESRVNLAKGEVLSPRLQALLHKRVLNPSKLQARLQQIQLAKTPDSAPKAS
jgi:transposase-like protein